MKQSPKIITTTHQRLQSTYKAPMHLSFKLVLLINAGLTAGWTFLV